MEGTETPIPIGWPRSSSDPDGLRLSTSHCHPTSRLALNESLRAESFRAAHHREASGLPITELSLMVLLAVLRNGRPVVPRSPS